LVLQKLKKELGKTMNDFTGVILAAGRGMRAYPATKNKPKSLLEIDGLPLIHRNIEIMRDKIGIQKIIVVVGHFGDQIVDYFKNLTLGVELTFVEQAKLNGIGHAILSVEDKIKTNTFIVMLADEVYIESNHDEILSVIDESIDSILFFKDEEDKSKISNNFSAEIVDGKVISLIEKPKNPTGKIMGVGTYVLSKKIFGYIRSTPKSSLRNEIEITDVLSNMARKENIKACKLIGEYVNVNNLDDLNRANYLFRNNKFDQYQISVVIPAYNEEKTIAQVVHEFKLHNAVSEVVVVDNNSKDDTINVARQSGARVVTESTQGYGAALKRGIEEAIGDIIILTEADGTFSAKDVGKLLEYVKDCDLAIGTRTTRQMIEQGANMTPLVRWVNVIYGKIVELLWWSQEPRFTDVGCTYRAMWKSSYNKIKPTLYSNGPEFAVDMMICFLLNKSRVIEIPVSYTKRVDGESKHSGNFLSLSKTALKMMYLIVKRRLKL
jgi:dTDP-glucose pyrophosphorylase